MYRKVGVFLVLLIGYSVAAQTVNITGKISNKNGKPIPNAIVTLAGQKLKDTTDSQGAFSFSLQTFVVAPAPYTPAAEKISMVNNIVKFSLTKAAAVSIEMFDLRGNLLSKILDPTASAGDYCFNVTAHPLAANFKLIRVSIGRSSSTFRHVPRNKGMYAFSLAASSSSKENGWLAKVAATIDTLKIKADNYVSRDTVISSYQGMVNITLDTMALAKFSFFVTSLKALQALSGSQNGFGGDLRFGKTGPGAGLSGADSICECIAEMSMPGSKVKKWRAFLSVAKDANGNKVNAIERIGTGPWYDRLGRLVSNTTSDLQQNRPNADAAIKNDLPNEDGVPNHRPDPNKSNVDNHQFITGSDTLGMFFPSTDTSNSTCQDWTSSAADGGKPRCGLSWPRIALSKSSGWDSSRVRPTPMNMQSWISVWNLFGCEAGLDITEWSARGKPGVYTIGNGGGYGGFYCFALNP